MKKYGFIRALYKSFYSQDLYRDVERNWGLEAVWYLLMVLALCWIAPTANMQVNLTRNYDQNATNIARQLPVFQIKEGQVITPENRPYIIKDPQEKNTLAVIDTSGKYKTLEDADTQFLITKDIVIYQESPQEIKLYKLPHSLSIQIVPTGIKEVIGNFIKWSWVLIFPFFLFLSFLYRIIQVFVYALLGKCFALAIGVKLNYSTIAKLCMVALTPTIIISTLFDFFDVTFHFELLFYFVLSMSYLAFAIYVQKNKQ